MGGLDDPAFVSGYAVFVAEPVGVTVIVFPLDNPDSWVMEPLVLLLYFTVNGPVPCEKVIVISEELPRHILSVPVISAAGVGLTVTTTLRSVPVQVAPFV